MINIISRYIIKEIVPNFFVGLAFFEIVMLVQQIFKLVDMHVKDNVPIYDVANLFLYTIPFTMQLTIPIGVLVGCLLAVGRLSGESEIVAMRASGMSLLRIFVPTFGFGLFITLGHLAFVEYVVPWGNTNYVKTYREIIQVNPTIILTKESSLSANEFFIQVDGVDSETRELFKVRIRDKKSNKLILAETGMFLEKDEEKNAFPLLLNKVTQQPYIQWRTADRKSFEEKYNEKQIIYIPDTKRKVEDDPYNIKSQAISKLGSMIDERENRRISRILGMINNYNHSFQKLQIMRDYNKNPDKYAQEKEPQNNTPVITNPEIINPNNNDPNVKINAPPSSIITTNENGIATIKNNGDNPILDSALKLTQNLGTDAKTKLVINNNDSTNIDVKIKGQIKQIQDRAKEIDSSFERESDELLKTYLYEYNIKIAIPFACFAFTLIGAPLGIFSGRSGKSMSLGFCLIIGVSWFGIRIIMSFGYKDDWIGPFEAAWIPNIILFTAGLILSINRIRG